MATLTNWASPGAISTTGGRNLNCNAICGSVPSTLAR